MTNAVTVQEQFRWREDDGSETAATWMAAEDVNPAEEDFSYDTNYRLRILIQNTGGKDETDGYVFAYSIDDGTWTGISPISDFVRGVTSGNVTQGDATTQQVGSGTHTGGRIDAGAGVASYTLPQGEESEHELVFQFRSVDFSGGEKVEIKLMFDNVADIDGYTVMPTLDVMPAPPSGTLVQVNFRWRPEGATEAVNDNAAPDWDAALNVNVTQDFLVEHGGLLTRLRIEVEETASVSTTFTPRLEYKINAGSWIVPRAWNYDDPGIETGTYDPVMLVNKLTTTDGAATTNILSGSSRTFVAGSVNHDAVAADVTLNNEHTELEFPILISLLYAPQLALTDGDTISFRITDNGTVLDTYTVTPIVTINVPSGYIGGTHIETSGGLIWIQIPDGTLYAPIETNELSADIMMLKSTDNGVSWLPIDSTEVLVANDMESFSMAYDDTNKIIHCLHVGGEVNYYQFATKDHATLADTWIEIGASTATFHELEASVDSINQSAEIILRDHGGGEERLYAFYGDDVSPNVLYYRMKPDLSSTNNWNTRVAVDSEGGSSDFTGVAAVVGPNSNLIHIFYNDYSQFELWHVSLDESDVLGTRHSCETDMPTNNDSHHGTTNAISWYNGSVEKAMIGFIPLTGNELWTVIIENDGTADARQNASNSVTVDENASSLNSRQPAAGLALDGNEAWVMYSLLVGNDLWKASNDDGAGWTAHTEEQVAVVHNVRPQVIDIAGDTVLAWISENQYDPAESKKSGYTGTVRWDSFVIAAGAGGNVVPLLQEATLGLRLMKGATL